MFVAGCALSYSKLCLALCALRSLRLVFTWKNTDVDDVIGSLIRQGLVTGRAQKRLVCAIGGCGDSDLFGDVVIGTSAKSPADEPGLADMLPQQSWIGELFVDRREGPAAQPVKR